MAFQAGEDSTPPDHSTPPGEGQPGRAPDPEAVLAEFGRRIADCERPGPDSIDDRPFLARVKADVGMIAAESRRRVREGADPVQAFADALAPSPVWSTGADPVLRLTLADLAGSDEQFARWHDPAWTAYLRSPALYDALLGEWMPGDFLEDAAAELARQRYQAGANPTAADDWPVFLGQRGRRKGDPSQKVRTGLPALDHRLGGGVSELTTVGGGTGVGKTSLTASIVRHGLEDTGLAVVVVELEMAKEQVYEMMLRATDPGAAVGRPVDPTPPDFLKRLRLLDARNLPRPHSDGGHQYVLAEWLVGHVHAMLRLPGVRTVLTVIDYVQRLPMPDAPDEPAKDARRIEVIDQLLAATTTPSHPAGMPVVCVSKVPKGRGPTGLTPDDLHGASELGYRASAVLFLEPDLSASDPVAGVSKLVVNVAKGRDGVTRGPLAVDFHYRDYIFTDGSTGPSAAVTPEADRQDKSSAPAAGPKAGRIGFGKGRRIQ